MRTQFARKLSPIGALLALVVTLFASPFGAPAASAAPSLHSLAMPAAPLPARSYDISFTSIEAELHPDGTLDVLESRQYDFDGSFNGVMQTIGLLGRGMTLEFDGASVSTNGTETALDVVDMQPSWRSDPASAPKGQATYDEGQSTFYAFHAFEDETATITFHYRIIGAGQLYMDTAELYWQFVAEGWSVPNENVELSLTLPVPEGEKAVAGDNVLIFGHGPLNGSLSLDDGRTVYASVSDVGDGDFAEVRVLLPVEWMSVQPGASNVNDYEHKQAIVEEEQEYIARDERAAREAQLRMRIGEGVGLTGVLASVAAAFGIFRRHGKEYRPVFQEKYWRDVPDPNLHPAVVAQLYSWGDSSNDIPVTLLHLANRGDIKLVHVPDEKGRYGRHGDWGIIRTNEKIDDLTEIDLLVRKLVFDVVGQGKKKGSKKKGNRKVLDALYESGAWRQYGSSTGIELDPLAAALEPARKSHEADAVLFSDFEARAKAAPSTFEKKIKGINEAVQQEVERQQLFEKKGTTLQMVLWGVAAAVALLGFGLGVSLDLPWLYWVILIGGVIAIGSFAWFMRRRTPPANEVAAKCEALKRWLTDFSKLNEAPPSDVKKWGELMVYAAAFGVADETLAQLRAVQPAIASDPDFLATGYWVGSMHSTFSDTSPFDTLGTSITSASSTAASEQASGSGGGGSFSFGGGGGFSGGGGGGFGGGGGGGAF